MFEDDDEEKDSGVLTKVAATFAILGTIVAVGLLYSGKAKAEELLSDQKVTQMVVPSVQLNKNCSGTIIHSDRDKESGKAETYVISAKHCVDKVDQKIDINIADYSDNNRMLSETAWKAKVIGTSYKSDLALIKLDTDQKVFVHIATIAPKDIKLTFGQKVYSVSFPMGFSKTFTEGTLGFVENLDKSLVDLGSSSGDFYRATPDITGGSSGSGLFIQTGGDIPEYQLVGVLTAGFTRGTFMNLYTPIEEIREYVDTASKKWAGKTETKKEEVKKETPEKKEFNKNNTWERAE